MAMDARFGERHAQRHRDHGFAVRLAVTIIAALTGRKRGRLDRPGAAHSAWILAGHRRTCGVSPASVLSAPVALDTGAQAELSQSHAGWMSRTTWLDSGANTVTAPKRMAAR